MKENLRSHYKLFYTSFILHFYLYREKVDVCQDNRDFAIFKLISQLFYQSNLTLCDKSYLTKSIATKGESESSFFRSSLRLIDCPLLISRLFARNELYVWMTVRYIHICIYVYDVCACVLQHIHTLIIYAHRRIHTHTHAHTCTRTYVFRGKYDISLSTRGGLFERSFLSYKTFHSSHDRPGWNCVNDDLPCDRSEASILQGNQT